MNAIKCGKWLLTFAVPGLLLGCQTTQPGAGSKAGALTIPHLESAYRAVSGHRQSPYASKRLPVRRAQKGSFRELARQCELLLAEVETWDSDARLVGIAEPERAGARDAVAGFRVSLRGLQAAAGSSDLRGVRQEYARVMASYRPVNEKIGSAE